MIDSSPVFRRSIFTVEVIVETVNLTTSEHEKQAYWVGKNLMDNKTPPTTAFVSYIVRDQKGNIVQFAGNGAQASPETLELIEGLLKKLTNSKS